MHDNEERFTYAGKSGRVTQTDSREHGPVLRTPAVPARDSTVRERYDREIGSHTKANVANDSQPVPNAP